MRISVDLNDAQIKALDKMARRRGKSRAALIRRAVDDFLAEHRRAQSDDAFGLWGDRKIDGLKHQEQLRSEW